MFRSAKIDGKTNQASLFSGAFALGQRMLMNELHLMKEISNAFYLNRDSMMCLPPRAPRPCRWSSASKRRSSGLIAGWMAWCAFSWAPCVPPSLCSQSHHRSNILFSNASYQYIVVFNASTLDDSYQYIVVLVLGIEVWVVLSPLYSVTHKALSKTIIYLYDNMSLYCSTMNNLLRMIFITVGAYFAYSIFFMALIPYNTNL